MWEVATAACAISPPVSPFRSASTADASMTHSVIARFSLRLRSPIGDQTVNKAHPGRDNASDQGPRAVHRSLSADDFELPILELGEHSAALAHAERISHLLRQD